MQRYFVKKENEKIVLSSQDLHHIKDVMRIKSNGQIVCVFDNASYLCKIEYDNDSYDVKIIEEITKDVELPKDVILYQALIKNDKFDLVIQKATELGVSMIYPTIFSRSVVKVEKDKMDKKLDSHIARGGTNVSGGQKQRLSIARAIIKKPEILIFSDLLF